MALAWTPLAVSGSAPVEALRDTYAAHERAAVMIAASLDDGPR